MNYTVKEADKRGKIKAITVNGKTVFSSITKFPTYSSIQIIYHDFIEISPPFNYKDARGESYESIVNKLLEAGFISVSAEGKKDLLTTIFTKNGEVDKVEIDGEKRFTTESKFMKWL